MLPVFTMVCVLESSGGLGGFFWGFDWEGAGFIFLAGGFSESEVVLVLFLVFFGGAFLGGLFLRPLSEDMSER